MLMICFLRRAKKRAQFAKYQNNPEANNSCKDPASLFKGKKPGKKFDFEPLGTKNIRFNFPDPIPETEPTYDFVNNKAPMGIHDIARRAEKTYHMRAKI